MNKSIFVIIGILSLTFFGTSSQDVIVTKNSKKIEAKVLEINVDNIKYKNFDNLDGAIYMLPKSDIVTIVYQNGRVETFGAAAPTTSTTVPVSVVMPSITASPSAETASAGSSHIIPATNSAAQTSAQSTNNNSAETLEFIALFEPDFIAVKPQKGIVIRDVDAWLVDGTKSAKALKIKTITTVDQSGHLSNTLTDKSEIRFMNFDIPGGVGFNTKKIKFLADGKEIVYDIVKSEWE